MYYARMLSKGGTMAIISNYSLQTDTVLAKWVGEEFRRYPDLIRNTLIGSRDVFTCIGRVDCRQVAVLCSEGADCNAGRCKLTEVVPSHVVSVSSVNKICGDKNGKGKS